MAHFFELTIITTTFSANQKSRTTSRSPRVKRLLDLHHRSSHLGQQIKHLISWQGASNSRWTERKNIRHTHTHTNHSLLLIYFGTNLKYKYGKARNYTWQWTFPVACSLLFLIFWSLVFILVLLEPYILVNRGIQQHVLEELQVSRAWFHLSNSSKYTCACYDELIWISFAFHYWQEIEL